MANEWFAKTASAEYLTYLYDKEAKRLDGTETVQRRLDVSSHEWNVLRRSVFSRDDYTCTYCGSKEKRLECDHIISVADGGSDDTKNLTTACQPCNRQKGRKSGLDWSAS